MAKLKTGRHTSALKEMRKSRKRQEENQQIKSRIKNLIKKVEGAVQKKDTALAGTLLRQAFSEWDKAVKRNIVHSNTAANKKARLSRIVASLPTQG